MSYGALSTQVPTMRLTAGDRDWIRSRRMTTRALAAEQRLVRTRLSTTTRDDVARVRERLRRTTRRFAR